VTRYALAVPFEHEQRLASDAARYGHTVVARCSGADELAARLGASDAEAVLVEASPQYLNARVVAGCDSLGIRLVVAASSPEQHRHARALGVVDAIDGAPAWHAPVPVPDTAQAAAASTVLEAETTDLHRTPVAPRPQRGAVIAVWGPAGAPGRTSLAIALAAELAATGLTVALADADTHAASVDPALGLLDEAPGFAAACRLAGTGALTVAEFERVAEWCRSGSTGFWVLTGLGRPSRWPELTASRVEGVVAAARDWVDVLVVDTASDLEHDEELTSDIAAPRRNAATVAALRAADDVVAVASADPIGLTRYLRGRADLLEVAPDARVTTVVNKVRSSAIGLNPRAQIAQTLARFGGISEPVLIPWDPAAFDAALLGGRPLPDAAPRSPARVAIRRLVTDRFASAQPGSRRGRRRSAAR
jgi:MinD-like ATPase involved in chromosome partitioning or flagellar assembly